MNLALTLDASVKVIDIVSVGFCFSLTHFQFEGLSHLYQLDGRIEYKPEFGLFNTRVGQIITALFLLISMILVRRLGVVYLKYSL